MARRRRAALLIGGGLTLLLAVAGISVAYVWRSLQQPFRGYAGSEARVEVPQGADAATILRLLESQGVLANATLARLYLVYGMGDPPLKAGEYLFARPLTAREVLSRLARGEVVVHPVTVIEGLTLTETARILHDAGFGALERFESAMRSAAPIRDLDPEATDLEGFLFPDTYHFARGTPEEAIVATLVSTFRRRFRDEVEPLRRDDDSRSVRQLVTLASIVEKEARIDDERPVIAGVYAHRLRRGMPLQADPTVIFALQRLGRWDGNLRRADLELDSPYNTYVYPGLPPGPIASPGLASLRAAARPAAVSYLYFVSRNDGSHVFADTLAEHNRNVYRWQKLYWRERWAQERQQRSEADSPN